AAHYIEPHCEQPPGPLSTCPPLGSACWVAGAESSTPRCVALPERRRLRPSHPKHQPNVLKNHVHVVRASGHKPEAQAKGSEDAFLRLPSGLVSPGALMFLPPSR